MLLQARRQLRRRTLFTSSAWPRAALATPVAPLRIARAPPGKAPQVIGDTVRSIKPRTWSSSSAREGRCSKRGVAAVAAQPFHHLRASSAVPPPPRAAPAIPAARRPRSSSPIGFEERGSDVGFGLAVPDEGEVDDPENTEPPIDPPPPQGLLRPAPQGAADGAPGAQQPVTFNTGVPKKAPPSGSVVPPRPNAAVYKPPPHGAFVAIIGKDPAGGRVRPPPSNLVHPNHCARRAREDWDRNLALL